MRRFAAVCITLVLCMVGLFPAGAMAENILGIPRVIFATPEDAILHLVDALARQDMMAALETSVAVDFGGGFDYVAYAEYIGTQQPIYEGYAPENVPVYAAANEMKVAAMYAEEIVAVYASLVPREQRHERVSLRDNPGALDAYMQAISPAQFAGLAVVRIDPVPPDASYSAETLAKLKENGDRYAQIYGAEEKDERVALLTLDGETYFLGCTLLRYGDSWRIESMLRTSLGQMEALEAIPEDVYLEAVGE